jgi:hypothetical protein
MCNNAKNQSLQTLSWYNHKLDTKLLGRDTICTSTMALEYSLLFVRIFTALLNSTHKMDKDILSTSKQIIH